MLFLSRIVSFCLVILAFGQQLTQNIVLARFQSDSCEYFPDATFTDFEIANCPLNEECFINKGQDISLTSWSFEAKHESNVVYLSVLIGSQDPDTLRPIISEMPFEQSDLCQLKMFQGFLGIKASTDQNQKQNQQCHLIVNDNYQLPKYDFYVSRLLPSGPVNITVILRGYSYILACALFRATLQE